MNGRIEVDNKIDRETENKLKSLPDFVTQWYYSLGGTALTRSQYVYKVANFLQVENIKTVSDITRPKIREYLTQHINKKTETRKKNSDSYKQTVWTVLKRFLTFIQYEYHTETFVDNLASGITICGVVRPSNKDLDRIQEERPVLKARDFRKILRAVDTEPNDIKRSRDKAILFLLMTTGMRESELCQIDIGDLDLDNQTLTTIIKGDKPFYRDISDDICTVINEWLGYRDKYLSKRNTNALFVSTQGKRVSVDTVKRVVKTYSQLGLGYGLSPHKLRGGAINIIYEKTGDIEYTRRFIHHSNIATTQRYFKEERLEQKEGIEALSSLINK